MGGPDDFDRKNGGDVIRFHRREGSDKVLGNLNVEALKRNARLRQIWQGVRHIEEYLEAHRGRASDTLDRKEAERIKIRETFLDELLDAVKNILKQASGDADKQLINKAYEELNEVREDPIEFGHRFGSVVHNFLGHDHEVGQGYALAMRDVLVEENSKLIEQNPPHATANADNVVTLNVKSGDETVPAGELNIRDVQYLSKHSWNDEKFRSATVQYLKEFFIGMTRTHVKDDSIAGFKAAAVELETMLTNYKQHVVEFDSRSLLDNPDVVEQIASHLIFYKDASGERAYNLFRLYLRLGVDPEILNQLLGDDF